MKPTRCLLALFLVIVWLSAPGHAQNPPQSPQSIERIGTKDLMQLIAANKGRVLVLNFWASWCSPCVKEFPGLIALKREYPESKLAIIGVSVDTGPRSVEIFLRKTPVNFPIYLDNGEISDTFAIQGIPRTIIFAPSGETVLDHEGYIPDESFRHVVERALIME